MRSFRKPGDSGTQILVGGRADVGAELARERPAVDGEVDRLAELRVVPEERPARVEHEEAQAQARA